MSNPRGAFGTLRGEGETVHGFSDGSWGLVDAIKEAVRWCGGEVALDIATWTASDRSVESMAKLLADRRVVSLRFIVDGSFDARKPGMLKRVREAFGDESVRIWRCHAKFAICRGDRSLLYLTSANLNVNRRIENWQIVTSPTMIAEYVAVVEELFDLGPAWTRSTAEARGKRIMEWRSA